MTDAHLESEEQQPFDLIHKLIVALRSVTDPQALMQSISDRSYASLSRELGVKIDSIEKAVEVAHADLVRVPTEVQKGIQSLRDLLEAKIITLAAVDNHTMEYLQSELTGNKQLYMEKFIAIEETITVLKDTINDRFTQNDQNTEKAFNAAKQAVGERDASNAASANKSEKNLMDAIGKLDDNVKTLSTTTSTLIAANKTSTDDKVNDLKDMINRLDNRISSGESSKRGSGESIAWLFGGISAIAAVAAIIGLIFTLTRHS